MINLASQNEIKHSPLPWVGCREGECECCQIWTDPGDYPVLNVTHGDWGDSYPNIKLKDSEAHIGKEAVPYIEKIVYGSVSHEIAVANIKFILKAVNNYYYLVKCLSDISVLCESNLCDNPNDKCSKDIFSMINETLDNIKKEENKIKEKYESATKEFNETIKNLGK
jgi:hypothetical protein